MYTFWRILIIGFIFISGSIMAHAASPTSSDNKDHKTCVQRGFILGKMEDPNTERYYLCRAALLRERITQPSNILNKLNFTQASTNKKLEEEAKLFDEKAKAAHEAASRAFDKAFREWDEQQSALAKKYDQRDNQTCLKTVTPPLMWGNPELQKYYICRVQLIKERTTLPPSFSQLRQLPVSRAQVFFEKKADEAEYAFKTIDEQTHQRCLDEGNTPGELDDPQTKRYYECRAKVAEEQMGPKIALMFHQRAEESANAITEARVCEDRGIKRDNPAYAKCRQNVASYRKCLGSIPQKLQARIRADKNSCEDEARLNFPKSSSPKRNQYVDLCLRQKEGLLEQYKAGFKVECAELMLPMLSE